QELRPASGPLSRPAIILSESRQACDSVPESTTPVPMGTCEASPMRNRVGREEHGRIAQSTDFRAAHPDKKILRYLERRAAGDLISDYEPDDENCRWQEASLGSPSKRRSGWPWSPEKHTYPEPAHPLLAQELTEAT